MQDDSPLRSAPAATLDEFDALGADIVKVNLYWDGVAPSGRRKPAGFDGANPGGYAWGSSTTPSIAGDPRRGMQPYFSLGGHAPDWATNGRGRPGTYRPSAKEFRAVRPGRRAALSRAWTSGRSGTSPTSTPGSARSAVKGMPAVAVDLPRPLPGRPSRPRRPPATATTRSCFGELMPRGGTSTAQGAPARVPARDGLPGPQLPPVSAAARPRSAAAAGSAAPHLGHRLPPVHAGPAARRARRAPTTPRSASCRACARTLDALARRGKLPAAPADLDHRVRLPDPPARPATARRRSAPPRSWTSASGSRSATRAWPATRSTTLRDDRLLASGRCAVVLAATAKPAACTSRRVQPARVRALAGRQPRRGVRRAARASGGAAQIESKAAGRQLPFARLGRRQLSRLLQAGLPRQRAPRGDKFRVTLGGITARQVAGSPLAPFHRLHPSRHPHQGESARDAVRPAPPEPCSPPWSPPRRSLTGCLVAPGETRKPRAAWSWPPGRRDSSCWAASAGERDKAFELRPRSSASPASA